MEAAVCGYCLSSQHRRKGERTILGRAGRSTVSFGLPLGVEVETVPYLAGMGESVVVGMGTTPIGCLQLKPGAVTFVTSARIAPAKAAHKAPRA